MLEMIIEMDSTGCAFETYWEQLKSNYEYHLDEFYSEQLRLYPDTVLEEKSLAKYSSNSGTEAVSTVSDFGQVTVVSVTHLSEPFTQFLVAHQLSYTQLFYYKVRFINTHQNNLQVKELFKVDPSKLEASVKSIASSFFGNYPRMVSDLLTCYRGLIQES